MIPITYGSVKYLIINIRLINILSHHFNLKLKVEAAYKRNYLKNIDNVSLILGSVGGTAFTPLTYLYYKRLCLRWRGRGRC